VEYPALLKLLNELPRKGGFDDLEMEHDFPALGLRTMLVSARRLSGDDGDDAPSGKILLSIRDATRQKTIGAEAGELAARYAWPPDAAATE
jgi:hypothetical protein